MPKSETSFCANPRLGISPGISVNSSVSLVRLSSRKLSSPGSVALWKGRKIWLNPCPFQSPTNPASRPSGDGAAVAAGGMPGMGTKRVVTLMGMCTSR